MRAIFEPELKGKIGLFPTNGSARGVDRQVKGEEVVKIARARHFFIQISAGDGGAVMSAKSRCRDDLRDHALEGRRRARRSIGGDEVVRQRRGGVAGRASAALLCSSLLTTFCSVRRREILATGYGSVFKPVSYKLWYPEAGMSTVQYDAAAEKWEKLLRDIGRKQQ